MTAIFNKASIETNDEMLSLGLYGYACFTALSVEHGKVKGLGYHMERLLNDSNEIFGVTPDRADIIENIQIFLRTLDDVEHIVVRVTIFPENFSLAAPEKIDALNIMVTGRPHSSGLCKAMRLSCVDAFRTLPFQKSANMISNLKARAIAHKDGFDDALMTKDGLITEGATWNVFLGAGKDLVTPVLSSGILPGITRRLIIENADKFGYSVSEEFVKVEDAANYAYCFATNAAMGVIPVASVDGVKFDPNSKELIEIGQRYSDIEGESIWL